FLQRVERKTDGYGRRTRARRRLPRFCAAPDVHTHNHAERQRGDHDGGASAHGDPLIPSWIEPGGGRYLSTSGPFYLKPILPYAAIANASASPSERPRARARSASNAYSRSLDARSESVRALAIRYAWRRAAALSRREANSPSLESSDVRTAAPAN